MKMQASDSKGINLENPFVKPEDVLLRAHNGSVREIGSCHMCASGTLYVDDGPLMRKEAVAL